MLDRKSAPQFAEIQNFHLPTPDVIQLNNGIPLIHYHEVSQDVIKVELIFRAGKWFETKKGVSHFTAQMLEKGTSDKNSFQIAEVFDQFGTSIEISAGFDYTSLSLYTLSRNIHEVLPLFCEIVTSPSFPESEFELMKGIFKQNLKVNNEKNSYVASKTIRQNIFGNHPYGNSLEEIDVNNLSLQDVVDFFKMSFTLHEIYVTGSIDSPSKKKMMAYLSDLSVLPMSESKIIRSEPKDSFSQHIEKPGSVQSSLRLGKKIINRNNPDYAGLVLLNHILGGYFGSRLMKNIREEKGLTYGIHSSISTLKNEAFFLIGTDVNKENRELALSEIKLEIKKLRENPIDSNELEIAKNHLLGSLQLEAANPFSIVEKIKITRLNQLNFDFYNTLFSGIKASQATDLKRIASYLNEDTLFEVSVG